MTFWCYGVKVGNQAIRSEEFQPVGSVRRTMREQSWRQCKLPKLPPLSKSRPAHLRGMEHTVWRTPPDLEGSISNDWRSRIVHTPLRAPLRFHQCRQPTPVK